MGSLVDPRSSAPGRGAQEPQSHPMNRIIPKGYISVRDALNRLGHELFPSEWMRGRLQPGRGGERPPKPTDPVLGRFLNRNFSGHLVPTNADIPNLDVLFVGGHRRGSKSPRAPRAKGESHRGIGGSRGQAAAVSAPDACEACADKSR